MKKILKNPIFTFIIGLVLAGTIGVVASNISASNISYGNTTLDRAMDDLYTKASTYKNLSTTTDVTATKLLEGIKAYSSDGTLVTGSIETFIPNSLYTPTTSEQIISTNGKYINGNIKIGAIPSSYQNTIDSQAATILELQTQLANITGVSESGNFTSSNTATTYTIPVNFRPSKIFMIQPSTTTGYAMIYSYDPSVNSNMILCFDKNFSSTGGSENDACITLGSEYFSVNNNGFNYKPISGDCLGKIYWYAIK